MRECMRKACTGTESVWFWRERTDARPKSGRPLQSQLPPTEDGFVEASPSHVLRDGEGMFLFFYMVQ